MRRGGLLALLCCLAAFAGCKAIANMIHNEDVVAQVGEHKLYLSDIEQYVPRGLPEADSTAMARQYIESWASMQLFSDMAEKELSKSEKDVSRELEDYRNSLLKYRYEQKYVNQRLDTAITSAEIQKYYEGHMETFRLTRPILKARFVKVSEDASQIGAIRKMLAEDNAGELIAADSLVSSQVKRYMDYHGEWVDAVTLAREFGIDYVSMLSEQKKNYVELTDAYGNVCMAYIGELLRSGQNGPVSYYESRIRDIILSGRKRALLSALERDLLESARAQENFKVYE